MPLDTTSTKQCYLHGRLVALIVNIIGKDKLPQEFELKCAPGTHDTTFAYWAREALKTGNPTLVEVAGKTNLDVPKVDDSTYWIGYFHQKSDLASNQ